MRIWINSQTPPPSKNNYKWCETIEDAQVEILYTERANSLVYDGNYETIECVVIAEEQVNAFVNWMKRTSRYYTIKISN